MHLISQNEFFMWLAIAAMVLLVSVTGMYINRFVTHRAHRQALMELRRSAVEGAKVTSDAMTDRIGV